MRPVQQALYLSACTLLSFVAHPRYGYSLQPTGDDHLHHKFRAINGVVLRIDAATPKHAVVIQSETGRTLDSPGTLKLNKVDHLDYSVQKNSLPIPKTIHVTWREGKYAYTGQGNWAGGTIAGNYIVPVAERIPDDLLDYIRKNGGALRLKIRLKDDGVLIGWDVEEWFTTQYGRGSRYVRPGGDFREAQIDNGIVLDPGW
ncbi:MAG: hypothetical protein JWP36_938 [Paucimonas sp.]|nr:hypothetical protein [Paucimonas sp.]